jgi:hypothetical protein
MKWKKLLHKQNAKHYAWPHGWDTAEEIAEQLECSPERVREHLAPSIRAGEVECKQFTIWDSESGRKIIKTGFRIGGAKTETRVESRESRVEGKSPTSSSKLPATNRDRWPFFEGAIIRRMDSPRIGVVKSGSIEWEDGRIAIPSRSQQTKLRLAK